jgi:hypothetical protein
MESVNQFCVSLLFVSLLHYAQLIAGDFARTTKTRFLLYDWKQLDVKDINLSLLLVKRKTTNLCRPTKI